MQTDQQEAQKDGPKGRLAALLEVLPNWALPLLGGRLPTWVTFIMNTFGVENGWMNAVMLTW